MSIYNKYYSSWFKGDNIITQGSGYADNVSLRNDGRTELRGDTYITNSGRLIINKDKNSTTQYYLDISGNSNFNGNIVISNKNTLSNIQIISTATTLSFGSSEYVCISSTFPNNSQITLPLVNNSNQLGTKFTFFYSSATYPNVVISANTGQTIIENTQGVSSSTINIDANKPFVEVVCIATSGLCWAQSNGLFSYTEFGGLIQDNTWTGENYFLTALTSDNSTKVATTAYVKSNLSSYQTTAGMSSYALLASPAFTGNPTATTQLTADNSTRLATTAYVKSNLSSYALLASPAFTGNPTATTQLTADNSTRLATTAYVKSNLSSYALLASPTFTGNPLVPTQLTTDNSTRIASTAYVKSNLSSYQTTSGMSSYALLDSPAFTGNPTATTQLTADNSTRLATTAYVKTNLADYVLQSYLIANYHTTTYIEVNFASLFTNNTFLGDCSFSGITNFQNNVSITNSKTLTITSGSNLTMDSGSNLYVNGEMTVTGLATFQSPNEPTLNGVRIANLDDIKYPQTEIYSPSFRSTTQSAGGVICGFNTLDGDSRFVMIDEGAGLTPNSAVIQTLAGNGIGVQSVFGPINFFCGTTLRTQVTSSGLDVTGNITYSGTIAGISSTVLSYLSGATSNIQTQINNLISGTTSHTNIIFTGTLNSMSTTLFSAINTAFGKQTSALAGSVITGAITLSAPFANVYSINNGATVFTITLPQASASNAGVILTFRRATGSTTTTIISLTTTGSTQTLYNTTNTGGTTLTLLASGAYIARICSITNNTTYGWYLL